jgi:hypothetical protein
VADGISGRAGEQPASVPINRFQLGDRPQFLAEVALGDHIKAKATELERLLAEIAVVRRELGLPMQAQPTNALPPPSAARYLALATSDLESAVTNALKALTA